MPFLYNIAFGENRGKALLISEKEVASIFYHHLFGFPLTAGELVKWTAGERVIVSNWQEKAVETKNGYYFLKGNVSGIYTRLLKERISQRKIKLAKKAAKFLSLIPTIKMVALTGALAMENAAGESDIDLLIVTKKGTLWTTRLLSYLVIWTAGIKTRRPGDSDQKDKLCLNIWLDEKALAWPARKRNIYTAHEIAQIKPLINQGKTYEKFLAKNIWIRDYWPNAVKIQKSNYKNQNCRSKKGVTVLLAGLVLAILEKLAFNLQYWYMRKKISREIITPYRAVFHPINREVAVLARLKNIY